MMRDRRADARLALRKPGTVIMSYPRRLTAAVILAGALSGPVHAADVTPAEATDLQEQLRAWMASLVKPALDVGPAPVQVAAAGDHFDVTIPAPDALSAMGFTAPGLKVTLAARPLDGGRYALDHLVLPQPLLLTMPAAFDTPEKSAKKAPDGTAATPPIPKTVSLGYAAMTFQGLLDPSYATTSSFDTSYSGLHIVSPNSDSTTAKSVSHSTWQPSGDGHLTILSDGSSENTTASITTKDGTVTTYSIGASHSTSQIKAVSPDSLGALVRSIAALVPTVAGTKDSLSPEQRALARTAVLALRDMFAGAEMQQSFQTLKFETMGIGGSIAKAGIATKIGTEKGKLLLATELSVEGVDSPAIPAGVYRDYLPRRIMFKPRVSGIPGDDLVKLLLQAIDSSQADMPALEEQAMALLGAGPLEVAIDDMAVDLGRASLSGNGTLTVASPTDISGDAQITLVGLDALIKTANTTPPLKQAAPVLIFLKGIGKQDGNETVWDIKYEDKKVTVNDTDLSDLIPTK